MMLRDYLVRGLDARARPGHNQNMSDAPAPRTGRFGGIFVAVVVGGSAVAVLGWYLMTNRGGGAALDSSGFDLSAAPESPRPAPAAAPAAPEPAQPQSSLGMLKADAGVSVVSPGGTQAPAGGGAAARPADKKQAAALSFTEAARKHEGDVRNFAMKMTNKYPLIRQYGKDWMSYPDLKKLNDDYQRNHDPIAFMVGLSRAPNFGTMMKKYAGAPEMREAVVQGMKSVPSDLLASGMDVLQTDGALKNLVSNVAGGMGLPPSITAMINGAGGSDPVKVDQKQILGDVMNNPAMRNAMQQQGQQPPAVALPNQR